MDKYYELPGESSEGIRRQVVSGRGFSKLFGAYRGIVEKTNDSFKIGYVRIRVPNIHSETLTPDQLPLGYVSQLFGGGNNYGTMIIPPVGSSVFVMFENGHPDYPIIIGTWYGDVYDDRGNQTDTEVPKNINNCLISHDQSSGIAEIDLQRETSEISTYNSTDSVLKDYRQEPRNLLIKSKKGHTVEIDDTGTADIGTQEDGQSTVHNEGIRFTTRLGQIVHIIDEPGQECILIKNADIKNNDGTVTPGNYIQVDQKTKNINIFSNQHINEEIATDRITHIGNNETTRIDNNQTQLVGVDKTDLINNNWTVQVGGNVDITIQGSTTITAIGPILVNAGGNATVVCEGSIDATVAGNVSAAVAGGLTANVAGPVVVTGATINLN